MAIPLARERGAWGGYEAGPKGLEILVIGAPNLGADLEASAFS